MEDNEYDIINDYLEGQLGAEEAAAVVLRAERDPVFAEELAARRELYEHLRAEVAADNLRVALAPLGERYFVPEQVAPQRPKTATVRQLRPANNRGRYLIAAAVAAAIALLVFFAPAWFGGPAGGDTYARFAQHQPLSLTERGDGDQGISAAEAAYNDGRYEEARRLLEPYVEANPADQRAELALGVSLLEAGEDAGAKKIFEKLADGQGAVAPYANWYLALAAVRAEDKVAALRYLDRIPTDDAYLRQRVADLREVLEYN